MWERRSVVTNRRAIQAMTLTVLVTASMGCSVIGFTAGAIEDSRRVAMTEEEVPAIAPGRSTTAVLRDGTSVTGERSAAVTSSGESRGPAIPASRVAAPAARTAAWFSLGLGGSEVRHRGKSLGGPAIVLSLTRQRGALVTSLRFTHVEKVGLYGGTEERTDEGGLLAGVGTPAAGRFRVAATTGLGTVSPGHGLSVPWEVEVASRLGRPARLSLRGFGALRHPTTFRGAAVCLNLGSFGE